MLGLAWSSKEDLFGQVKKSKDNIKGSFSRVEWVFASYKQIKGISCSLQGSVNGLHRTQVGLIDIGY